MSIIIKCLFGIVWFFLGGGSLRFYSLPFDFNISFLILFALEYFVSRYRLNDAFFFIGIMHNGKNNYNINLKKK